jgi:23S rRNA (uridine2552-2'-O)-methyltransferase
MMISKRHSSVTSSKQWIQRQISDRYVRKAQELNYRSRAAFKLIQIDDRFSILRPSSTVVDLGCFSGGWSQVALARCPEGSVIGIDKIRMDDLPGHHFIQGDITEESTREDLKKVLNGKLADVVISDMAPAISGNKLDDHDNSVELSLSVLDLIEEVMIPGGWFVIKSFYGPRSSDFVLVLKSKFKLVRTFKPEASRSESSEIYYVCARFKGNGRGIASEVPIDGGFQTIKSPS